MGVFTFTPEAGKKYELKIDSPVGVEGQYLLPASKDDGVVLSIPTGGTTDQEPIRVIVRSAKEDRSLFVGAYCRGRLMAHQQGEAKKGEPAEVLLKPETGDGGVYRVTVFEHKPGTGGQDRLTPA